MELYHIIPTGIEILARDSQDYFQTINQIALSSYTTNSEIIAYAIMSTHTHTLIKSKNIGDYLKSLKCSYTKYYNNKYKHKGPIFNNERFIQKIESQEQSKTAITYILKNPVHHNTEVIAFNYPYSSINIYYKRPLPYLQEIERCPKDLEKKFISHNYLPLPEELYLNKNGYINPKYFINTNYIKSIFRNQKNFNYHMNKPVTEEIQNFYMKKQNKTMEEIDEDFNLKTFKLTDIELCAKIDSSIQKDLKLPHFEYTISQNYRLELAYKLIKRHLTKIKQVSRCLGLSSETIEKYI